LWIFTGKLKCYVQLTSFGKAVIAVEEWQWQAHDAVRLNDYHHGIAVIHRLIEDYHQSI